MTEFEIQYEHFEFDGAYESMKQLVAKTLSDSPSVIRQYMQHLLGAQGKHIRAKSLLCCAMDKQNRIEPDAVTFAAAIELLHLATLVHDDVIDNADIRRGIPTLQKKFGQRKAVICGDYLFSTALKLAASVPDKQKYLKYDMPDYISLVCYGELRQMIHSADADLQKLEYFKIISGKTAALFEASYYGGAILSGCTNEEASRYKRMGWYAGMIFQLLDDCSDYESTKEIARKAVQTDYEQGVITLPLIHAMERSPECRQIVKRGRASRKELKLAVKALGGLEYTHFIADRFHQKLRKVMDTMEMTCEKRERLHFILQGTLQQ